MRIKKIFNYSFWIAAIAVFAFMSIGFIVLLLDGDPFATDMIDMCSNVWALLGTFAMFLFLVSMSGLAIAAVIAALCCIVKFILAF